MYNKLLLALILLVLVLVFIFQNTQTVTIRFLVWEVTTSRGLTVLIILLVGLAIGWLGRAQLTHRRRR